MTAAGGPSVPDPVIARTESLTRTFGSGRTEVRALLRSIVHDEGITAIVATHDPVLIGLADRVLNLSDGVLS